MARQGKAGSGKAWWGLMSNNKTVTALTTTERNVLADFADGEVPAKIAKTRDLPLDTVTRILVSRAAMSRARAHDLAADPDPAESPLTAPIGKPNGGKVAKAAPAPSSKPVSAVVVDPDGRVPGEIELSLRPPDHFPVGATPEPEPTSLTAEQILDQGIDDIAARLRTLIAALAANIASRQRTEERRARVAELEAALGKARAELATHDSKEAGQ